MNVEKKFNAVLLLFLLAVVVLKKKDPDPKEIISDPDPELVFINISWRAEILGFGCKTDYLPNPSKSLFRNNFEAGFGEIPKFSHSAHEL